MVITGVKQINQMKLTILVLFCTKIRRMQREREESSARIHFQTGRCTESESEFSFCSTWPLEPAESRWNLRCSSSYRFSVYLHAWMYVLQVLVPFSSMALPLLIMGITIVFPGPYREFFNIFCLEILRMHHQYCRNPPVLRRSHVLPLHSPLTESHHRNTSLSRLHHGRSHEANEGG